MHVLDLIIAGVTIFFVFIGVKRGLIGEFIRLGAMIAGCVSGFIFCRDLASRPPFAHLPIQSTVKHALAFILIYLICACAVLAAGWLVKKIVHSTPLGWIDRLAGGGIGLLKALLIAYVLCLSISSLPARRIRNDFGKSVIYRGYTALPKGMSLKSLLKKRAMLRTIFNKKTRPSSDIGNLHRTVKKFKASVDSAKEAHSSGGEGK